MISVKSNLSSSKEKEGGKRKKSKKREKLKERSNNAVPKKSDIRHSLMIIGIK
jgi:hypothetical protein